MFKKYSLAALCSLLVLGVIFVYQYFLFNDEKLHVTFCNVGQGDGIFIRTPKGLDIIIDGGPDNKILSCLANNMPFWDKTIELMILTHPHEDHYYGLKSVAKRYTVKSFVTQSEEINTVGYNAFIKTLQESKANIRSTCQDDSFTLRDGVKLKTLWPKDCTGAISDESEDLNSLSVVQLLSFENFQLLLTGDIDESIVSQIDDVIGDIDVLKIPHHGSSTGFKADFLKKVTPELAVISVGAKNRYGHPAKTILQHLEEKNIQTLRTDQQGDIKIISDGKSFWVSK